MSARKKKGLGQGIMCAIAKHELGYGAQNGISLYVMMARVLKKHGYERPEGSSHKAYVMQNVDILMDIYEKAGKPKKPRKNKESFPDKGIDQSESNKYFASKEFLSSFDWRRLRMEALKTYGARCQCCGASPSTGSVMHVDHIKPRKTHPDLALDINNLQILCEECNHGKGNWDSTDWRAA